MSDVPLYKTRAQSECVSRYKSRMRQLGGEQGYHDFFQEHREQRVRQSRALPRKTAVIPPLLYSTHSLIPLIYACHPSMHSWKLLTAPATRVPCRVPDPSGGERSGQGGSAATARRSRSNCSPREGCRPPCLSRGEVRDVVSLAPCVPLRLRGAVSCAARSTASATVCGVAEATTVTLFGEIFLPHSRCLGRVVGGKSTKCGVLAELATVSCSRSIENAHSESPGPPSCMSVSPISDQVGVTYSSRRQAPTGIHLVGLAPWEFEFPFLTSTFLAAERTCTSTDDMLSRY